MKKWYKSKTVIFNGVTAIVTIAMAASEMNLSPKMLEVMGTIAAVGNVILRLSSTKPIETPLKKAKAVVETPKEFVDKIQVETKELKDLVKSVGKKK